MKFNLSKPSSYFLIGGVFAVFILGSVLVLTLLRVQNPQTTLPQPKASAIDLATLCPPGSDCFEAAKYCVNEPPECKTNPAKLGWPLRGYCSQTDCNAFNWNGPGIKCNDSTSRCNATCPGGYSLVTGSAKGCTVGLGCSISCSNNENKSETKSASGTCVSNSTPQCRCGHFWRNPDPISVCTKIMDTLNGTGTGGGGNGGGTGSTNGMGTLKILTSGSCSGYFIRISGPTATAFFQETVPADNLGIWATKSTTAGSYLIDLLDSDKTTILDSKNTTVPIGQMATVNIACTGGTGGTGNQTCNPACPAGQSCVSGTCTVNTQTTHLACGTNNTCQIISGAGSNLDSCTAAGASCTNEENSCWGNQGANGRCYDCNGDGAINILDFSCLSKNYLQNITQ